MKSLLKYQLCLLVLLLGYAAGKSAPKHSSFRIGETVSGTLLTNFNWNSTCLNDSVQFKILDDPDMIDSVKWNFGDPASGALDSSNRKENARHTYTALGTYTVTLTAFRAGVADVTTQTITIVNRVPFVMDPDMTLCDSTAIDITVPLIPGAVYTWNDTIPGTNVFHVTEMGTYKVKIDGCAIEDSTNVFYSPVPDFDLGPNRTLCTGEILTLDATAQNAEYVWSTGATDPTIIVINTPGTYWVAATVTGCGVFRDTVTLNFSGTATPFSMGPDTLLCQGETVLLQPSVPNAMAYRWNTGATTPSILVRNRGAYSVFVTTNTATGVCDVLDTIQVNYNPLRDVNLGNDTTICRGNYVTLTADYGTGSYLWQDGSKQATFYVDSPGYYYVRAQIGRCVSTDTIRVNVDDTLRVNLGLDTVLCRMETLRLFPNGAGTNYKWQDSSAVPSFLVTQPGIYAIVANNTCNRATDSIQVNFQQCDCTIFFPTGFSPNNDGHNDYFRPVYRCVAQDYKLTVYNRWGELVFFASDPAVSWNGTINGKPCTTGTYVWIVEYKDGMTGKEYKQRGTVTLIR